jgi:hypothetical protein
MANNTVYTVHDHSPGAVRTNRSVLIKNAFVQNSADTEVAIRQPKGTILTKAVFRFASAVNAASTSTFTVDIGPSADKDSIIDGGSLMAANAADPAENSVVVFDILDFVGQHDAGVTSAVSTASTSYATEERELFVTIITSDHAITTNGDLAVTLFFDVVG